MKESEKEKLRIEFARWYKYGLIEKGTDFVADYWLLKLDQALTDKVATIRGDIEAKLAELINHHSKMTGKSSTPSHRILNGKIQLSKQFLSLPSLLLPASIEENE